MSNSITVSRKFLERLANAIDDYEFLCQKELDEMRDASAIYLERGDLTDEDIDADEYSIRLQEDATEEAKELKVLLQEYLG